jgi:hypothetical protein
VDDETAAEVAEFKRQAALAEVADLKHEAALAKLRIARGGGTPQSIDRLLPGVNIDRLVQLNGTPAARAANARAWQAARDAQQKERDELRRLDRSLN